MLLSRECDRREGILFRQGRGWFHVDSAGHEAQAVFETLLEQGDLVFSYYRDRAIAFSVGLPLTEMARIFFARGSGVSLGRNMPGHLSWQAGGLYSATSPIGAQCLPAIGAAWGQRIEQAGRFSLCLIGDAATRQGEFYEALCMAVQKQLPVIFLVEDNGYGISTPTNKLTPLGLNLFRPGLFTEVDGADPVALFEASRAAVIRARNHEGPTVLWAKLDRLGSHSSSDDERLYRSDAELSERRDPISILVRKYGLALEPMKSQIEKEVKSVYLQAEGEAEPEAGQILEHLLAPAPPIISPPRWPPSAKVATMRDAVNTALRLGLEHFPNMMLFGEDIEDPKGGVFGLTRGLSNFFPGRVENSPLAEATLVGSAVGLAATGQLPVVELQFIDFVGPALNQLMSQASNLRWRSGGDWSCPLVLYAPCGAYLPGGGMWHSQSGEALLARMAGVRLVMPASPEDAFGAFWSAFSLPDPTIILLPKHLFFAAQPIERWQALPVGIARVLRTGNDITLIAWGNTVELAQEAAEAALQENVDVEILDLRWLLPWDYERVRVSLRKTGRLVIVQEDSRTCSMGESILAKLLTEKDEFYSLRSMPRLLSRPDSPMPFSRSLEKLLLPSVESVLRTLREVMQS
jgi:2-oxoisovalerate dehydrogenase E1 component